MLNDYKMSILYHPNKANVVAYSLSFMTTGSVYHIYESKNHLVRDVHMFSRVGIGLEYF